MWKPYQRFTDQVLILANKVDGNLSNLWLWRLFGSGVVFEDDDTAYTGVVMIFSMHSMKLFTGRSAASVCFTTTVHRQLLILKLFYCVKIKYAIMNKILYMWPGKLLLLVFCLFGPIIWGSQTKFAFITLHNKTKIIYPCEGTTGDDEKCMWGLTLNTSLFCSDTKQYWDWNNLNSAKI